MQIVTYVALREVQRRTRGEEGEHAMMRCWSKGQKLWIWVNIERAE